MTTDQFQAIILLLDNLFLSPKKYSRTSFADALEDKGLPFKPSFITKVLSKTRDLGINIVHSHLEGCYQLDTDDNQEEMLLNYQNIKNIISLEQFSQKVLDDPILFRYVQFGHRVRGKGYSYLPLCLEAILTKRKLQIVYESFKDDKPTTYIIEPLFVKEYLNRWYIITRTLVNRDHNIFALDRIHDLEITQKEFTLTEVDSFAMFDNTIGIDQRGEISYVRLKCDQSAINYIRTLPWHDSFKEEEITADYMIFSITVRLNHELESLLISYGSAIEVLEPVELRTNIKNKLQKALNRYV